MMMVDQPAPTAPAAGSGELHWHDFFASWPLLYVSHLMILVFDGARPSVDRAGIPGRTR